MVIVDLISEPHNITSSLLGCRKQHENKWRKGYEWNKKYEVLTKYLNNAYLSFCHCAFINCTQKKSDEKKKWKEITFLCNNNAQQNSSCTYPRGAFFILYLLMRFFKRKTWSDLLFKKRDLQNLSRLFTTKTCEHVSTRREKNGERKLIASWIEAFSLTFFLRITLFYFYAPYICYVCTSIFSLLLTR